MRALIVPARNFLLSLIFFGLPTNVGIRTRASHGTHPGPARTAPAIPRWVQEETLVAGCPNSNICVSGRSTRSPFGAAAEIPADPALIPGSGPPATYSA